jgi:hypothetical protein
MKLMNVEVVQLHRAVFDDPILDLALLDDDVGGSRGGIERRRRLPVHGDVEGAGAGRIIRIVELL